MSPILRQCLDCGALTPRRRCPQHEKEHQAKRNRKPVAKYHRSQAHRSRRIRVLRRDSYRCRWCGAEATECDFVVPLSRGGERSDSNAVAACRRCNASRGADRARPK